ncbi:MAG: trypsin-like peptidase domain-containing protein [Bacteroidales bacterium]|nr:trypsin-like peptidase domain-containing protein [Bacteroidales bacterium]
MKTLTKKSILLIICTFLSLNIVKAQNIPIIDFTKAAEHTVHAVVHIQSDYAQQTNFYEDFFGFLIPQQRSRTFQTSGSGVIINSDGYIVTNNHVVQDADSIQVILNDKRRYKATIVGNDASADLAVIKIDAKDLPIIEFGDSDNTKIGQWVLAVGNPFNLTSTVTAGIISAKARNLNILGNKMNDNPLKSFIQTDAAVNPGNSGGALVDLEGKLIGINTAIASNTGSYAGYSFAIPSNIVREISSDIINHGTTQIAYLGVNIAEIDSRLAESKGIKNLNGVYIVSILENGAAKKSGLREGDVIIQISGKDINYNSELNEVLSQSSPGDIIKVKLEREGKVFEKEVTLLNEKGDTSIIKEEEKNIFNVLNAQVRELTVKEKKEYQIENGYILEKIINSPFARLGIRKGFIITSIDKNINISSEDLKNLSSKKGKVVIEGFYPNDYRRYYFILVL